jgi:hypothetical protein
LRKFSETIACSISDSDKVPIFPVLTIVRRSPLQAAAPRKELRGSRGGSWKLENRRKEIASRQGMPLLLADPRTFSVF